MKTNPPILRITAVEPTLTQYCIGIGATGSPHNENQQAHFRIEVERKRAILPIYTLEGNNRVAYLCSQCLILIPGTLCACGNSIAAPGVGYKTQHGWICKSCGDLHTISDEPPDTGYIDCPIEGCNIDTNNIINHLERSHPGEF